MHIKIYSGQTTHFIESSNFIFEDIEVEKERLCQPCPADTQSKLVILDENGKASENFKWMRKGDIVYVCNDSGKTVDKYSF